MEGLGENFGSHRTVKMLPQRRVLSGSVQGSSADAGCAVCRCASDGFLDEASFSNLPHLPPLAQLLAGWGDVQLEHEGELSAELPSDGESHTAARPVLPPSKAIGVTFHTKNKQWEAHLWVKDRQLGKRKKKGTQIFLGSFQTEDDAKAAHDRAAIKLDVRETKKGTPYPLNFPASAHARYMAEHADWSPRDFVWKIRRLSHKFSKGRSAMKGVSVRCRTTKAAHFGAKISQTMRDGEKRTFDLGKFAREEDAGRAYDRALLFLKGGHSECVTNFRPSEYSVEEIEEAGRSMFGTASS